MRIVDVEDGKRRELEEKMSRQSGRIKDGVKWEFYTKQTHWKKTTIYAHGL